MREMGKWEQANMQFAKEHTNMIMTFITTHNSEELRSHYGKLTQVQPKENLLC